MRRPPSAFAGRARPPFDAVLVSSRCRTRIATLSLERPDALIIGSDPHVLARNGIVVAVPPQEKLLLLVIASRRGAVASYEAIEDAFWGDDPDGGPEDTRRIIGVVTTRLRPLAALLGFRIEARWGFGLFAVDLFPSTAKAAA